jgi:hypothetical protein
MSSSIWISLSSFAESSSSVSPSAAALRAEVEEKGETRTDEATRKVEGLKREEAMDERVEAVVVEARRLMARGAARAKDLADSMVVIEIINVEEMIELLSVKVSLRERQIEEMTRYEVMELGWDGT